jgi:hypothetical protein
MEKEPLDNNKRIEFTEEEEFIRNLEGARLRRFARIYLLQRVHQFKDCIDRLNDEDMRQRYDEMQRLDMHRKILESSARVCDMLSKHFD